METKRKKVGLALGSGGVKGLAHIGVIKTLLKHNIPIDYLAGCSIGSWMAVHYALFQDIAKLEHDALSYKREKFISVIEPSFRGGFIRGKKLTKLLQFFFHNAVFADLKIPCSVVATDLVSSQPVVFSEGRLVPAVQASMAIPSVFKPITMKDKILVDGGITNPVPDDVVKKMGADIVIAVNLDNYTAKGLFDPMRPTFTNITTRSFQILRQHLARHCMKDSDVILNIPAPFGGFESLKQYFTTAAEEKMIKLGEEETEKAMPLIKKLLP